MGFRRDTRVHRLPLRVPASQPSPRSRLQAPARSSQACRDSQAAESIQWVKVKPPGDRRFESLFPFTTGPFWVPIFDCDCHAPGWFAGTCVFVLGGRGIHDKYQSHWQASRLTGRLSCKHVISILHGATACPHHLVGQSLLLNVTKPARQAP